MPLKTNNLKFIINLKLIFTIFITFIALNVISAQEIIQEPVKDTITPQENVKLESQITKDSINTFKAEKVDGVAAVVGDFIILDSDVDKAILQLEAQGVNTTNIPRCQLFGKLLEDKLYAHHAIQDSLPVSDAEIRQNIDYQIQQFLQSTNGSMEKLLQIYEKEDEKSLREEMFEINKSNELAKKMQAKIVEEVEVTPEEVREFFNKIPKDDRPTFGTELKVAQIVVEPKITPEEKQRVIDQLKQFKADVLENGASFRSKVVLYGEDPGIKQSGYIYTLNRKRPKMVKEFRQAAFSLQEGEISEPFETDFGFHIVYCEKIRGQEYDVSHILLIPKVSTDAIKEAKERIDKIRQRIVDGDISFADAARESSDEKETRNDGGQLINPETQDYNFELTRMDPELYSQIQNLKEGEVSLVQTERDRTDKIKFKILTVSDRVDEHEADYARDYLKIKEQALNEKKLKAIETWQNEKIMDTYIKISGSYRDCDFASNWLKQ
ncbi:MAG: peptidylprolyl isomerase [Flavobacteriales bacterium]|nr:peptidylprolyl isomerase [Flavobacteriia bacterium]NCP05026.1 peptidylprolyl isomerase [Flavobacteriales bacterium]PIV94235.1 MAG: peptidylprolyl isomerase [Flavobacteriaceae bacterium CG17_big_fil_post_rev_8_21_14_2_50_33_15]PIY10720.1 MAG: peptidylprolyl isomerase [Flavobacteriaceae bacterium CG_4_10_14_3_um_filter_33_47]PJB19410.1 MAG: peptidylprolyl isomerase [Flavobacteriaceae bacterium CG_4_9_14_3_um_filter_33_16]